MVYSNQADDGKMVKVKYVNEKENGIMLSSSELRYAARERLRGNWGMAVLVFFLYTVISIVLAYIPIVGSIGSIIISGPLMFGLYAFYLHIVRGQTPELNVMFSGFQLFGKTLLLYILQSIFVFLWSLLLIIPGIIAALRYSMAYFIMHDNPDISAMDAIRQSKEMMRGYKGNLFVLYLTFIGWFLLALLTFGIGFLWLAPYVYTTVAAFYEQLKSQQYVQPDTSASLNM